MFHFLEIKYYESICLFYVCPISDDWMQYNSKGYYYKKDKIVVIEHRHHKVPKRAIILVGSRIKKRPVRSIVIYYNSVPYLYANGVYYKFVNHEYEVIKPQIGITVPTLPKVGLKKIRMKDEMLYSYNNVLYKKIITSKGVRFKVQGFVNQ